MNFFLYTSFTKTLWTNRLNAQQKQNFRLLLNEVKTRKFTFLFRSTEQNKHSTKICYNCEMKGPWKY